MRYQCLRLNLETIVPPLSISIQSPTPPARKLVEYPLNTSVTSTTYLHNADALAVKPAKRLRRVLREELSGLHLRLMLARILLAPIPIDVGGRLRVLILRLIGFEIGHGTIMAGTPTITGSKDIYRNLTIGRGCWINVGCLFDLGAAINIGNNVSIGHEVIVLTNSHEIGTPYQRAAKLCATPVTIDNGAWLGSRCTILPGVNIGAGAIVAAGAVVHHDVPPNTLVAGVPARVVKLLS